MERYIFHHPKVYRNILTMGFLGMLMAGIGSMASINTLINQWSLSHARANSIKVSQLVVDESHVHPVGWEDVRALPGKDGSGSLAAAPMAAVATQIAINTGDARSLGRSLSAIEFGDQHWSALQALWDRESGWNPASRNRGSGACGIPQALPCSKIPDMSPQGQIQWGLTYIRGRYGNPSSAWQFWQSHHWY